MSPARVQRSGLATTRFVVQSDHMGTFLPNRDLTITSVSLGHSGEPLLIVDDFLADPGALVAAACAAGDWADMAPGGYPGWRAGLPAAYVQAMLGRLDAPIRRRLVDPGLRFARFDCSFSMVTRTPDELTPLQQVPHIDIANPNRVAVLHYFCGPAFGGTAFSRQDATGYEQIGPSERDTYLAARTAGRGELAAEHAYPSPDTPGYTRTGFVEARFNRLVVHRSFSLHSGIIETPSGLSPDPSKGRLTTTAFVDYNTPQG